MERPNEEDFNKTMIGFNSRGEEEEADSLDIFGYMYALNKFIDFQEGEINRLKEEIEDIKSEYERKIGNREF